VGNSGMGFWGEVIGAGIQAGGVVGATAISADAEKYAIKKTVNAQIQVELSRQQAELAAVQAQIDAAKAAHQAQLEAERAKLESTRLAQAQAMEAARIAQTQAATQAAAYATQQTQQRIQVTESILKTSATPLIALVGVLAVSWAAVKIARR